MYSDIIDDMSQGYMENPWSEEEEFIIAQDILNDPS